MNNLKREFLSGTLYTGLAKYAGLLVSIIVSAILARLVAPSDFGVVAISSIFINFFSTLTTVGISPAIVQNKTISEEDLKEINTFTFVVAFSLTFIFLACVPLITDFYGDGGILKNVLVLLAVSVFFSIAAIVPNAMLLKHKNFKFIAVRTFCLQVIFGIISVIGAFSGMGIYALLISPIGTSISLFVVNFKKHPIGFSKPGKRSIDKIFSFSIYQMLFNLIYLLYRNIDKLILGRTFGMANLGYYEKSYRLMMLPVENLSGVMSPVLHPILSEYQDQKGYLWEVYKKMFTLLSEICFLISVVLFFLAEPIILMLYGEKWEPSIPIFQVLALSVCFQLLQTPIGAFFQAVNRVKDLMWSSLYIFVMMLVCISISVIMDDFAMFPPMVVVASLLGMLVYEFYICRAYQKHIGELLFILLPHVVMAFILFGVLYIVNIVTATFPLTMRTSIIMIVSFVYFLLLVSTNRISNTKEILLKTINKTRQA